MQSCKENSSIYHRMEFYASAHRYMHARVVREVSSTDDSPDSQRTGRPKFISECLPDSRPLGLAHYVNEI